MIVIVMENTCSLTMQAKVGPKRAPGKGFSKRPPTKRSTSETFLIVIIMIILNMMVVMVDSMLKKKKNDDNMLLVIAIVGSRQIGPDLPKSLLLDGYWSRTYFRGH